MDQTSTSSHYHSVKHYGDSDIDKKPNRFNIEFVFDCDVRCAITIYYFCTEEVSTKGVAYVYILYVKFILQLTILITVSTHSTIEFTQCVHWLCSVEKTHQ